MTGARRARVPLRVVLAACFVLIATISAALLLVQRYLWITREYVQTVQRDDIELSRVLGNMVDTYLARRHLLVKALGEQFGRDGSLDVDTIRREVDNAKRREPAFTVLFVTDRNGTAIAFSPAVDAEGRSNVGRHYADREWFARLMAGQPPVYEVIFGRAAARHSVAVPAPIRSPSGDIIGVVVGGLDLGELRDSIRAADPVRSKHLIVLDPRGRAVAHPSAEIESGARDLATEPVFRAAQRQASGMLDYRSAWTGDTRFAAYVRGASSGWVVWVSRGEDEIDAIVRSLVTDLVLSAAGAIFVAGLVALYVARQVTRPLGALVEATKEIANERFDTGRTLLDSRSTIREFDELLAGFGGMAATLHARYDDLEAQVRDRTSELEVRAREAQASAERLQAEDHIRRGYAELAALLNSLDRSQILEEGTRKIAVSLHAPLAAVFLTEDGEDQLKLKTYTAVDASMLDAAVLAPTGVPREAARRRETIVVTGSGAPLTVRTGLGSVNVAAVVAAPLMHQTRLLGVLVVALVDAQTAPALGFLANAAPQLSVALSNAGLFESVRHQSQQLEQLNADLRRAGEVKSQFLASMSHELRTPLNSIIGFTELVLASSRDPLSERQRDALERVHASGKHLLALINDVLDLSKIEAGRLDIRPESFALSVLVAECIGAIEHQAQTKALALRMHGLDETTEIVQDRARIKQILLNLLSNAVKFTDAGSVEVSAAFDAGGRVTIAVADTGIGIDPEDQETIFEAFRQIDTPERRTVGGTGLGLAISRHLARLLGGTLTVESAPGRGSVFTLAIPARYSAASPSLDVEAAAGTRRVLVIDDDADVAAILRQAVADMPLAVDWASTAQEGLAAARARPPAAILVDIMLQGHEDGWDVLRALKANPATKAIPVVIHSAIDSVDRARALGADRILMKPTSAADARALLEALAGAPHEPRHEEMG